MTKATKQTAATEPPERQPGRAPHVRDPRVAKRVETWVALGVAITLVGQLEHMDCKTLRKWYGTELQLGAVRANARVAQALFRAATEDRDVKAMIFWMRSRAGWIITPAPLPEVPLELALGKKTYASLVAARSHEHTAWADLLEPHGLQ